MTFSVDFGLTDIKATLERLVGRLLEKSEKFGQPNTLPDRSLRLCTATQFLERGVLNCEAVNRRSALGITGCFVVSAVRPLTREQHGVRVEPCRGNSRLERLHSLGYCPTRDANQRLVRANMTQPKITTFGDFYKTKTVKLDQLFHLRKSPPPPPPHTHTHTYTMNACPCDICRTFMWAMRAM